MIPGEFNQAEPWARQPFDGDAPWAWFQEYLALSVPRRLADLARRSGCPYTWAQLETLSFEYGWELRAQRWDSHLDRIRTQTIEDTTRETARDRANRQGRLARKLQRAGELELNKLLDQIQRDGSGFGLLQPRDLLRFVVLGIRAERMALGDTTDKIENVGPDLSGFSVEDLRRLRELQDKAGGE